jgi:hypothetical protein
MNDSTRDRLDEFVTKYISNVRSGFETRWNGFNPEIYDKHVHECVGGLLARQATLSIELAKAPSTWNGHVAPLFLRSMADALIMLSWLFGDLNGRSIKYIHYGLGQEKLSIEYLEEQISESTDPDDIAELKEMVKFKKAWLNSQRAEWATEVNVGSWSGSDVRRMAKEVGRESLYKFSYVPFSGVVHNTWQHVGVYQMRICGNPLHKYHAVPTIWDAPLDPDYLLRSARYVSQSYQECDMVLGTSSDVALPEDFFWDSMPFSEEPDGGAADDN